MLVCNLLICNRILKMMQPFLSSRNRDRAKWLLVILMGFTVVCAYRYFDVLPAIGQFLRVMSSGKFFFWS